MPTEAEALVTTMCIHTSVLTRPGSHSTLVHILTAGFPGVSWKAMTFVWSHTLPELASRFTRSFTDSLVAPPPAIAAGQLGSIATDPRLERRCQQPTIPWTRTRASLHVVLLALCMHTERGNDARLWEQCKQSQIAGHLSFSELLCCSSTQFPDTFG